MNLKSVKIILTKVQRVHVRNFLRENGKIHDLLVTSLLMTQTVFTFDIFDSLESISHNETSSGTGGVKFEFDRHLKF